VAAVGRVRSVTEQSTAHKACHGVVVIVPRVLLGTEFWLRRRSNLAGEVSHGAGVVSLEGGAGFCADALCWAAAQLLFRPITTLLSRVIKNKIQLSF
jgi:hypothetical protein